MSSVYYIPHDPLVERSDTETSKNTDSLPLVALTCFESAGLGLVNMQTVMVRHAFNRFFCSMYSLIAAEDGDVRSLLDVKAKVAFAHCRFKFESSVKPQKFLSFLRKFRQCCFIFFRVCPTPTISLAPCGIPT